ncbi:MAG: hypothetical protein ACLP8S_28195 [Solirubrobacteraceae bacterium]
MLFGSDDFIDSSQATSFIGLGGDANAAPTATGGGDAVLPYAGTLSNLEVSAVPNATSGKLQLTVEKDDAGTVLTCTITAASPAGTAQTCADTADSVSFAAGDKITVLVNNGTGSFVRYVRWTAEYS